MLHLCSSSPLRTSSWPRDILVRVFQHVVLTHVMLSPLFSRNMFDHHLTHVSLHEPANESRIPKLRSDSQIFAAAHERVRFAALGRGGNAVGIEVLLFAAGEGDESVEVTISEQVECGCEEGISLPSTADKAVFSRYQLARHDGLSSRRQTPASRAESLV